MNIFQYAMQMEKDGENYYRQLIEKTANKGLKTIFTMLAEEEGKHYNALEKMATEKPKMADTTILEEAKNVFAQLKNAGEVLAPDIAQIESYKKAQNIEARSRDFYLEKAEEVEKEYQRELLLKLAEEEKKHYFLLDNIIEFVSRPDFWLENAEFCHLEEY